MATFELEPFYNEFLPEGGSITNAVITISAPADLDGPSSTQLGDQAEGRCELIIIDTSNSMEGARLREAKAATVAALDCIPDGVRFAVIGGSHTAEVVYAVGTQLAVSSSRTREEAGEAVRKLEVSGGTAIGTWIDLARNLLTDEHGIKHAILLTDGRNEHETPEELGAALARAEGVFQCDCRGVGADWEVAELSRIANALLGTFDIVAEPSGLAEDFAQMMQSALKKQIPEVSLRIWTPQGAEVLLLKQMEPLLDLTSSGLEVDALTRDYTTGSWGVETRDYHLQIQLTPGAIGDKVLAARLTLLVGGQEVGRCAITSVWTDDVARSTEINRKVAEATGDAELADAIQEGVDAYRARDLETATNRFSRAVRLASASGNTDAEARLAGLVEIEDAATGRVKLRDKVEDVDVMILETRSTRTTRSRQ
jgi:hypothetical protein